MGEIKQKSGILTWNEENIRKAPNSFGFYILRNSPINGDIISMEATNNLNSELSKIFFSEFNKDIKFFEWYETETEEAAKKIKEEWKK